MDRHAQSHGYLLQQVHGSEDVAVHSELLEVIQELCHHNNMSVLHVGGDDRPHTLGDLLNALVQ